MDNATGIKINTSTHIVTNLNVDVDVIVGSTNILNSTTNLQKLNLIINLIRNITIQMLTMT